MKKTTANGPETMHSEHQQSDLSGATDHLLDEGKKFANEVYENNSKRFSDMKENIKQYCEDLSQHVQQNPLTSVLIASCIGYMCGAMLRK